MSMEENRGTTVDKEQQPTYGIWMLPVYVRRKYQQNQLRMSKTAEPSPANKKLNKEIEKSARWNKVRRDDLERWQTDSGSESNLGT